MDSPDRAALLGCRDGHGGRNERGAGGIPGDGTIKVTDAAGNDLTETLKTAHSQFDLLYTHFFSFLKDDEKSYELHRFYQYPSTLSIGWTTRGYFQRDSRLPIAVRETKSAVGVLTFGGGEGKEMKSGPPGNHCSAL